MTATRSRTTGRREFVLTLLLGAAGAGLALLAVRQGWARADYVAPAPLPSRDVFVTGQQIVPAAGALALAGLACLAAVIATRGAARRAAGMVLAAFGAGTVAVASSPVRASSVLAAAASQAGSSAGGVPAGTGAVTGGTSPGGGGVVLGGAHAHAVMAGMPWRAAVVAGGLAIAVAGALAIWRGTRWPVMSARFDRPGRSAQGGAGPAGPAGAVPCGGTLRGSGAPSAAADPASIWEALSRGIDPTDTGPVYPPGPADAASPGPPGAGGAGEGAAAAAGQWAREAGPRGGPGPQEAAGGAPGERAAG
jgi:uncharacterized membrane protein (TIGR02234 family)